MWKWSAVTLSVVLVLACTVLALGLPWPPRVTQANFEKIKVGMSRADVEAVLGPPGDYSNAPTVVFLSGVEVGGGPDCTPEDWTGDEGMGCVAFNPSGKVEAKKFWPGGVLTTYGPVGRLLWRLERRWKALTAAR